MELKAVVQNLSIAARYDQKFASGVPSPVGEPQKPKLKSGLKKRLGRYRVNVHTLLILKTGWGKNRE